MNSNKLQIWICCGIIIVCIAAYLLIGCVPWCELKKHKDVVEQFICPWDIIKDLSKNETTNKIFIKDKLEDNKQMLDMFVMKTYDKALEEMNVDKYQNIINDIGNYITENKIDKPDKFIKLL